MTLGVCSSLELGLEVGVGLRSGTNPPQEKAVKIATSRLGDPAQGSLFVCPQFFEAQQHRQSSEGVFERRVRVLAGMPMRLLQPNAGHPLQQCHAY